MPILRWLGFSLVTSLLPMTMLPAVGSSKPATMRSTVVLPQPDGPRKETNSPGADIEVEVLHDGGGAEGLADVLDAEEGVGHVFGFLVQFGRLADRGAKRDRIWITDMQPQVMTKAMMASAAGS